MSDQPFGPLRPAWTGSVQTPDVSAEIHRLVPDLGPVLSAVTNEQLALVAQVASDEATHEAVRVLFALAVNDFRDLLGDLTTGSGRSAARAARALVEHAVNLHSVASSLAEAQRYVDHLDLGPALVFEQQVGADQLRGNERKAYLHSLKKTGQEAQRRFRAAVLEHGSWFTRGWAKRNLRDRAHDHDLDRLYDYYRVGSLVAHGSAGGSLGTIRDHPDGFRIFRTGPALDLAPFAMLTGLEAYQNTLDALALVRTDLHLPAYRAAVDHLVTLWPSYFRAVREIDKALWPDGRTASPKAVMTFSRDGQRRWFLHVPHMALLFPAAQPTLDDQLGDRLDRLVTKVLSEQSDMFRNDQHWLSVDVAGVTVAPSEAGTPIPDMSIMEFPGPDAEIRSWAPDEY